MHVFDRSMAENNVAALFVIFGLAALGGSIVTGLLVISSSWALIYLALGRLPLRRDPPIVAFNAVLLLYFGVNALFFMIHFGENFASPMIEWRKFAPHLIFLGPVFMVQRLALSPGQDLLKSLSRASAIGTLLVLPLALYQCYILLERAEGGSGNAIPFAMTCALLSMLSLPSVLDTDRSWRLLGVAGFISGFLCIFLSQTKGLMPMPLIAALVFGVFFLRERASLAQCVTATVLLLVVAAIGFYASGSIKRFTELSSLAAGSDNVAWSASYTIRLDLWTKALDLIQSGLIDGHGLQNRRALIAAAGYSYSHFHNGFITTLVDNGILGLVALLALLFSPLVIAWRGAQDGLYAPRLFMAFCLVSTYAVGGLSNFIFGHDIYDAMFLWIATVIVASAIAPKAGTASADPDARPAQPE